MKIDIGVGGKIIGTKRVSQNGQVSGLSEYAGQEVLVVLPSGTGTDVSVGTEDFLGELVKLSNEHMKLAFKQYKVLRETYGTPNEATKVFMKQLTPKTMHSLVDQIDLWVKDQAKTMERHIEKSLKLEKDKAGGPSEDEESGK